MRCTGAFWKLLLTAAIGVAACERQQDGVGVLDTKSSMNLNMLVRDFRVFNPTDPTTNPDFENVPAVNSLGAPDPNRLGPWDDRGIVADRLGDDGTPVYREPGGQTLTTQGQSSFNQWFHDVPGVNMRIVQWLPLVRDDRGNWSYDSLKQGVPFAPGGPNMFFPVDDGQLFAKVFGNQGNIHNYAFTVVVRATFIHVTGGVLRASGNDDVFVFIDRRLAVDLGGIHDTETAEVALDGLALVPGNAYSLDLFFAQRHQSRSSLAIETNFDLTPAPP